MQPQILRFEDMPFEFQRSIVLYGGEDGIVDWTALELMDWFNENTVQIWIDDYSKIYANRKFRIGTISIEDVKEKIMPAIELNTRFDNFDEYHKWYYDGTDHGSSVFPIVVSNEAHFDGRCEYIEDGWHRFHSYVHKKIKHIPFVEYI